MNQPPLPEVPLEVLGPLRMLVWAARVLREAVEDTLSSPEPHQLQGRERALLWAGDVVVQWIYHVRNQPSRRAEGAGAAAAGRAAAAKQAMGSGARKNGTSKGPRKRLRTGDERGTVKRR